MSGAILIFGASGVFGRLIAEDLLARTDAPLTLAARRPAALEPPAGAASGRIRTAAADVNDPAAVRALLRGAAACVLAVGPFQRISLAALDACCDLGVPYIDINDARDYFRAVVAREERIRRAGIPVLTGLSSVPGLSSLCVAHALDRLHAPPAAEPRIGDRGPAVRIALLIGNRNRKGAGATGSLLAMLGRPFEALENGRPVRRRVWGGRRAVRFLAPVGVRIMRDVESPDYDLLPRLFGATTVQFTCGFDMDASARGMEGLALLRRATGLDLARGTGALLGAARFTAGSGTAIGALRVEVGLRGAGPAAAGGGPETVVVQIATWDRGQRIAAIPAAVGARHLWERRIVRAGLLPMHEWIRPEACFAELKARGFRVEVRGPGSADPRLPLRTTNCR